MKSILLTFVMLVLILSSVDAQDPAFSQFYANKLYLNPAFAGSQEGLTLSTAYRNQWSYVPGGFNTYAVSADIQEPYINSAFGFLASKDIEGEGLLTTTNVGFVYGYILKINKTANIHVGIKTSFAQKTVDWTRFTFTDQLDPILGIVRPTTAAPIIQNKRYADFDAGMVARFQSKLFGRDAHNNIGFAVHHLAQPDESMQEIESPLPRRYTFHAGTMVEVVSFNFSQKRVLYFSPNMKFDYQDNIKILTYGFYAVSNPMYVGIFYQNKNGLIDFNNTNALILTAGFEGELNRDTRFTFGYSYDLSTTGLGVRTYGTHEITLMMNFGAASMFGLPKRGRAGKGLLGSGRNRRGGQSCYKFQGKNSISIY
ncbi:MAG: type IX secretion system PorP/SprF family membrane protein [Saprospiraceae bacterium]|jgi:type IX secretion system PorP/SprF family membrane protein